MADHKPLRVLILGIVDGEITFLDRLITGLSDQNIQIILSHTKRQQKRPNGNHSIQYFWTPPIKQGIIRQVFTLIYLLISSLRSKHNHWLKAQVKKEENFKDKIGVFIRYAPFCHGAFDVIYFPWNSTAITYHGLFDLGLPVIISCRGSQINIRPHLPGQQAFVTGLHETFQKATAVHCISKDIQHAAEAFGLDPKKVVIIHPAVNTDFFSPVNIKNNNKHLKIIMIGSLRWSKGYEYGLIAFSKFLKYYKRAELHIIGDGIEKQNLLFTINDIGIENNVIIHGKLTPSKVRDKLRESDIFLHSSLSEGFTNAVLEAQACGLPVICFNTGGLPENIIDNVSGFLIPLRDTSKMARALNKLAIDPVLRKKMGIDARKRVLNKFDITQQIDDFITLFTHLASKKN